LPLRPRSGAPSGAEAGTVDRLLIRENGLDFLEQFPALGLLVERLLRSPGFAGACELSLNAHISRSVVENSITFRRSKLERIAKG
jgi:hypothetical protein